MGLGLHHPLATAAQQTSGNPLNTPNTRNGGARPFPLPCIPRVRRFSALQSSRLLAASEETSQFPVCLLLHSHPLGFVSDFRLGRTIAAAQYVFGPRETEPQFLVALDKNVRAPITQGGGFGEI